MRNKTREQRTAIVRGFIVLVLGLIIGIAYLGKFFPMNPITHLSILAVWTHIGWIFAGLAILYGLCEIFIKGDL